MTPKERLKDISWHRLVKRFIDSSFSMFEYFYSKNINKKEITEQYPDPISSKSEEDLPKKSRGFLKNDITRCIACGDCKSICPSNCITIESEVIRDVNQTWISRFDIDFSKCIFCGLCVDACDPKSLVHTAYYEGATTEKKKFIKSFGMGELSELEQIKLRNQRDQEEQNQW